MFSFLLPFHKSVYLSIYLSNLVLSHLISSYLILSYPPIFLSIHPAIHPWIHPSIHCSHSLSLSLSLLSSVFVSASVFESASIHPSNDIHLSTKQSVQSIYSPTYSCIDCIDPSCPFAPSILSGFSCRLPSVREPKSNSGAQTSSLHLLRFESCMK